MEFRFMRVLIPVDGGLDCREAVRFLLARKSWLESERPDVELLYVQKPLSDRVSERGDFDAESYYAVEAQNVWTSLTHELEEMPVSVKKTFLVGHAAEMIADYANVSRADLIVMGARGLTPMKNLYMGSVSQSTIARAKCPVLICRDGNKATGPAPKVGLSVDGSSFGPMCADYIIKHRGFFGPEATFEIIHVVSDEPLYAPEFIEVKPIPPQSTWADIEELEFNYAVHDTLEKFDVAGVPVGSKKLVGDAEVVLPDYAENNLDIMVMGSHGKSALRSLVFGSATRAMIAACNTPVLVVPGR